GWREAIEGRRDGSLVSLRIYQDGRKLAIDAAGIRLPKANDAFGNAKNFRQERHRVSSQVEKRTASQSGIEDTVIARKVLSVVRIDGLDLADGLGYQELAKHIKFRKVKRPKRFGEKKPFSASQFYHFEGLGTIESDRLFHEHVLACVECQRDPVMMQIVRGGHIDHIEIVGSNKLLVVAVGPPECHARCEFLRPFFAA